MSVLCQTIVCAWHAWDYHRRYREREAQATELETRLAQAQLQALRKEADPRVAGIRQQTDERLQKVLTPEQWKQFQQMREEMRSKNRRRNAN